MYYEADFQFSQGRFSLRLWGNGKCNVYVDGKDPGLDAEELMDLNTRICEEIYHATGFHIDLKQVRVTFTSEYNYDSPDPQLRELLQLAGVKSMTFYDLVQGYLKIYEKTASTVRVETGGKPASAYLLVRALRTPGNILEGLQELPALQMEIAQRIDVLTKGQADYQQHLVRQEELQNQLTAAITFLTKHIDELLELFATPSEVRNKVTETT